MISKRIMHPINDSNLIATLDQDREEGLTQFLAKSNHNTETEVYNLLRHAIYNDKQRLTRHIIQNTIISTELMNEALTFAARERKDWACEMLVKAPNLIRMSGNQDTISGLISYGYFDQAHEVYAKDIKSQIHGSGRYLLLNQIDLMMTNRSLLRQPFSKEKMSALMAFTDRMLKDCQTKHDLRGLVEGKKKSFNARSQEHRVVQRQYENWLIAVRGRFVELPEPKAMIQRQKVNALMHNARPKIKAPKLK